jgi:hypothetical protein
VAVKNPKSVRMSGRRSSRICTDTGQISRAYLGSHPIPRNNKDSYPPFETEIEEAVRVGASRRRSAAAAVESCSHSFVSTGARLVCQAQKPIPKMELWHLRRSSRQTISSSFFPIGKMIEIGQGYVRVISKGPNDPTTWIFDERAEWSGISSGGFLNGPQTWIYARKQRSSPHGH